MKNLVKYFKNKKRCEIDFDGDIISRFYESKNKKIWYVKRNFGFYKGKKIYIKTEEQYFILNAKTKNNKTLSQGFLTKKDMLKSLPKFLKMVNDFNK